MKRLVLALIALICISGVSASAQHIPFVVQTGDKTSKVLYEGKPSGDKTVYVCTHGTLVYRHTLDSKFETVEWTISEPSSNTSIVASRKDGKIVIKGTFKGKAFERTDDLEGLPWYQQIGISASHVLGGGTVKFKNLRPDDLAIYEMTAKEMGETDFKGQKVHRVKVAPAGVLAKFWSSDYYYNPVDLTFVGYNAVEGGPGTPMTYWYLDR